MCDLLNRNMQSTNSSWDLDLTLSADIQLPWREPEPCTEAGILTQQLEGDSDK